MVFKRHNPGCGTGSCSCFTDCIIASDDFGDGSLASYTQLVGTWTEASGYVQPDPLGSDSRLRYDVSVDLGDPNRPILFRVRIRGANGDRAGIVYGDDQDNYIEATVLFGSGSLGRLDFNEVVADVLAHTYNADLQCADNEYNIPPDEWVTLTLRLTNGEFNVILEVDATEEVHVLGGYVVGALFAAPYVGLRTGGGTQADVRFDDLSVERSAIDCGDLYEAPDPPRFPGCEPFVHCWDMDCEAAPFGQGDSGWTTSGGTWGEETVPFERTRTNDSASRKLLDYEYLNDNLSLELGIWVVGDVELESINQHRIYFSYNGSTNWYMEATSWQVLETPIPEVNYFATWAFHGIYHDETLKGWILTRLGGWFAPTGHFAGIEIVCWDCKVRFGVYAPFNTPFGAWWSDSGSSLAVGFSPWAVHVRVCLDDADLNRTGKIGIGTGNEVHTGCAFTGPRLDCSLPFDCADYPQADIPIPDDPEDPTGCCDEFATLQTGDHGEITFSSWTYWFGSGCDDSDCALDSDFITDLNNTFTLTCIEKNSNRVVFTGELGLTNPCDDCEGMAIPGTDIVVLLDLRVEFWIERINSTECLLRCWVRSKCGSCTWYFQSSPFTASADCSLPTLSLISGNANPGGYNCCLQAGSLEFTLS